MHTTENTLALFPIVGAANPVTVVQVDEEGVGTTYAVRDGADAVVLPAGLAIFDEPGKAIAAALDYCGWATAVAPHLSA